MPNERVDPWPGSQANPNVEAEEHLSLTDLRNQKQKLLESLASEESVEALDSPPVPETHDHSVDASQLAEGLSHPAPDPENDRSQLKFPTLPASVGLRHVSKYNLSDRNGPRNYLPDVGDEVLGFKLRAEMGRGAFARVFLAEQAGLGDRPVVVKVSAINGDEPQTLAQLQHTHIVPVYSVHEDAKNGWRFLCMPYFGGASLSQVLETMLLRERHPQGGHSIVQSLNHVSSVPRAGSYWRDLVRGTRAATEGNGIPGDASRPKKQAAPPVNAPDPGEKPLRLLSRVGFVQAAAWIVARLAEALQHAHERGILHRDLKPSNVLLTAEGQPMLLDFNLAQSTGGEDEAVASFLGGTVAYMAPEHLRAMAPENRNQAHLVDHRSDIYSLGMVLFEILTGRSPFAQSGSNAPLSAQINAMALERGQFTPSVKKIRRDVPWSLESIVRKCLAPAPADRYQRAGQLAEDLDRFLKHLPLKYAPELSWKERVVKWAHRHPRLTSSAGVGSIAAVLTVMLGVALFLVYGRWTSADVRDRMHRFETGAAKALCLINTQTVRVDGGAQQALRSHLEEGIHVSETTLGMYGVLTDPHWTQRRAWQRLSPEDRRRLAGSMQELLLGLAEARFDLAKQHQEIVPISIVEQALTLLDLAEKLPGLEPSAALFEQRAALLGYLSKVHDKPLAARAEEARTAALKRQPVSARDYYLLGVALARQEQFAPAIEKLRRAVDINPKHYWSWFRLGLCYSETQEHHLALAAYDVCIALWPEFAWAYLNRGGIQAHLGQTDRAIEDFKQALEHDPHLADAHFNLAFAYQKQGKHHEALASFSQVPERGDYAAAVPVGRGVSLEALGRHDEADRAFARGFQNPPKDPSLYLLRGFALIRRNPEQADQDFQAVLKINQACLEAWYGKAVILADYPDRCREAVLCLDKALALNDRFVPALRGRAVLLARLGRFDRAVQDAQKALDLEKTGENYYAAACVYALMTTDRPPAGDLAVEYLRKAFDLGYGRDRFEKDRDLDPLRHHPGYQELLQEKNSTMSMSSDEPRLATASLVFGVSFVVSRLV